MTRTRCPDPRCGKPRAEPEDFNKHNDKLCKAAGPCVACRVLCWLDFNASAHDDLPEASYRVVTLRIIERVTQDECTCGGNAYEDPLACPACKVYHRLRQA